MARLFFPLAQNTRKQRRWQESPPAISVGKNEGEAPPSFTVLNEETVFKANSPKCRISPNCRTRPIDKETDTEKNRDENLSCTKIRV